MLLEVLFSPYLRYVLIALCAGAVAQIITPIVANIASDCGILDYPGDRRLSTRIIPRAGGVSVFLSGAVGLILAALVSLHFGLEGGISPVWIRKFLLCASILLIVGLLDDKRGLNWTTKLAWQLAVSFLLFSLGTSVGSIAGQALPFWLDAALTVIWIVAFINAFNLIDGLDGLAAGLATIAFVGLGMAFIIRGVPGDALVTFAMAGALIGFLRYNFPPASIFLGDSGSMLLGFSLAAISLESAAKGTVLATFGVPLLAAGVPLFDTMLAVWRRSIRRLAGSSAGPTSADQDHLHHRLVRLGLSHRRVAITLYAINFALVTAGVLSLLYNSLAVGIMAISIVIGAYVSLKHLASVELWDSGRIIVSGLSSLPPNAKVTLLYPLLDGIILVAASLVSVLIIGTAVPWEFLRHKWLDTMPIMVGFPFISIYLAGAYERVWSRARVSEFALLGMALLGGFILAFAALHFRSPETPLITLFGTLIGGLLSSLLLLGLRAAPRLVQDLMAIVPPPPSSDHHESARILVYGAGSRGLLYVRRLAHKQLKTLPKRVIGFIDDDRNLRKRKIYGIKVLGRGDELPRILTENKVDQLVLTCQLEEAKLEELKRLALSAGIILTIWSIWELDILTPSGKPQQAAQV